MGNLKNRLARKRKRTRKSISERSKKLTPINRELSGDKIISESQEIVSSNQITSSELTNSLQNYIETLSFITNEEIDNTINESIKSRENSNQYIPFNEFNFQDEITLAELLEAQLPEINFEFSDYTTYLHIL